MCLAGVRVRKGPSAGQQFSCQSFLSMFRLPILNLSLNCKNRSNRYTTKQKGHCIYVFQPSLKLKFSLLWPKVAIAMACQLGSFEPLPKKSKVSCKRLSCGNHQASVGTSHWYYRWLLNPATVRLKHFRQKKSKTLKNDKIVLSFRDFCLWPFFLASYDSGRRQGSQKWLMVLLLRFICTINRSTVLV